MNEVIQVSEPTNTRRRIYFRLTDSADNVSGKSVTTTGVKAELSINGAAGAASTNDIVQIDSTNLLGEYYVELTTTECGTLGTVVVNCKPTGALAGRGQATVVNYDPYQPGASVTAIADGLLDRVSAIDGLTPRQIFRLIAARLFGNASGLNSNTGVFKAIDGSKTRSTGVDDGSGDITYTNDGT